MHVVCFAVQMEDDVGGLIICAGHHHETEMRLHAPRVPQGLFGTGRACLRRLFLTRAAQGAYMYLYLLRYLYSPVVDSSIARLSVPECLLGP